MKIKGIKRGNNIELLQNIDIPDGIEVIVEVPNHSLPSREDQWQQLQQAIGSWKDDPEIDQIFNEIDKERHTYRGRNIDFDCFE